MKTALRTSVTALALVAPLAAVVPPAAQAQTAAAAPQIYNLSPSLRDRISDRGFVRISARVAVPGGGVDRFRLYVDNRDVTRAARFDGSEVSYGARLPQGLHTAELAVRDHTGVVSRESWGFVVGDPSGRDRRDNRRRW